MSEPTKPIARPRGASSVPTELHVDEGVADPRTLRRAIDLHGEWLDRHTDRIDHTDRAVGAVVVDVENLDRVVCATVDRVDAVERSADGAVRSVEALYDHVDDLRRIQRMSLLAALGGGALALVAALVLWAVVG